MLLDHARWLALPLLLVACDGSPADTSPQGGGGTSGSTTGGGGTGGLPAGGTGGTGDTGGTGGAPPMENYGWKKQEGSPAPGARYASAMAYDTKRDVVVLYGGKACTDPPDCNVEEALQDLWEWNGTAWTEIPMSGAWPGPRERHAMAYDPVRGQVVLHGGGDGGMLGWDGSTWQEIVAYCNLGCPLGRQDHAFAFHPGRGHLVLYSGVGGALNDISISVQKDSYELIDDDWHPIGGAEHPDGRVGAQLAYDADQDVMWLFGGSSEYSADSLAEYPNDVWKLDEEGWHRVHEGGFPPPDDAVPWGRRQAVFTWHPGLHRTVLFGGFSYPATMVVDSLDIPEALSVWTWDGTVWTKRPEWFSMEAFRQDQAAVYHAGSGQIVQHGGLNFGSLPSDRTYLFGAQ